jgi:hypothetical protein
MALAPGVQVLVPGALGLIVAVAAGPQAGLAAGVILEAVALKDHGLTALLLLGALWCAWQRALACHAGAAALFLAAAVAGTHPGAGWAGCGGTVLALIYHNCKKRGRA